MGKATPAWKAVRRTADRRDAWRTGGRGLLTSGGIGGVDAFEAHVAGIGGLSCVPEARRTPTK